MKILLRIIAQVMLSRCAFIVFSIAFVGYSVIGIYLLYSPGGADYWEHLASMRSFSMNPANPANPYILSDKPTHLFTPYHLFWGVMARSANIDVFWLLPVIAGINAILFVSGAREFCRKIIQDEKYALIFALTMLFFWIRPWAWSGFYNFGQLPIAIVYPYWFALSASLFLIAGYGESIFDRKRYTRYILYVLYSLSVSLVFLSHPLTGSFLILGLGAKALFANSVTAPKRLGLLALPLLGVLLAPLWPYFPVLSAILGSSSFSAIGFAGDYELFYNNAALKILPSLLGLPFLAYLLLKRRFTFVPIALAATASIYFLNYIALHNSTLARYIIFIAFYCQVGIILCLKHFEDHVLHNYLIMGFLLVTLILAHPQLILSAGQIAPLRRHVYAETIEIKPNVVSFRQYSKLRPYLGGTDVVMAPMINSWHLPGIVECRVVGVIHSNPFMRDYYERKQATEKFFREGTTTDERYNILTQYSVSHILVPKGFEGIVSGFKDYLTPIYKHKKYDLYAFNKQHN